MKYTATLEAHYSRRDNSGNCYWALRFIDHETGKVVVGTVCGGESNIYAIRQHWNNPNGWDGGVLFTTVQHGKRDFKQMVKDWPYAGCDPLQLAQFIRHGLDVAGPCSEYQ